MKDLLEKLSSYNLFNNLFPGIIFVIATNKLTNYNFAQDNLILGVFLYYFIGLVINRIGSLLIEPLLKKISFVKFVEYNKYVIASQKDATIIILSEINNMYRTICALFVVIIILKVYEKFESIIIGLSNWRIEILILILLLLFLFSYRKQTKYIHERVNANI
ncbi:MAG: hypothetical protein KF721_15010 [Ignavibacteriaceae bacterium]|nr:hypothetical protein [Ignavibacteriaceae bacterium]